jgi:hypothetical protein
MAELARVLRDVRKRIEFLKAHPGSDPAINRELESLGIDLHVLEAAAGILRKYDRQPHPRRGQISEESNTGVTRTILMEARGPLHINDILERLKIYTGREVKRGVLTSRLSKMARNRNTFIQVAPATYGLIGHPIFSDDDEARMKALAGIRRVQEAIKKPT